MTITTNVSKYFKFHDQCFNINYTRYIFKKSIRYQVTSYKLQATSYKRSRYKLILLKSQANGSGTTVQDTSDNIWLPS